MEARSLNEQEALLISMVNELNDRDSWSSKTHIQKSLYFLKELCGIDVDFDFMMFKHGPYSFDLKDKLGELLTKGHLKRESNEPYGPTWEATEESINSLQQTDRSIVFEEGDQIEYVADFLSDKNVSELERYATALYVTENADDFDSDRTTKMEELKPHIPSEDVNEAIEDIDQLLEDEK